MRAISELRNLSLSRLLIMSAGAIFGALFMTPFVAEGAGGSAANVIGAIIGATLSITAAVYLSRLDKSQAESNCAFLLRKEFSELRDLVDDARRAVTSEWLGDNFLEQDATIVWSESGRDMMLFIARRATKTHERSVNLWSYLRDIDHETLALLSRADHFVKQLSDLDPEFGIAHPNISLDRLVSPDELGRAKAFLERAVLGLGLSTSAMKKDLAQRKKTSPINNSEGQFV
ncbi:hypothetical protein J7355_13460 [Endozoicomonas sp. G2_2]|uniref:hypothetical protein n=1 Tax=Endozoicomonas sp. G2_2 TaxID=2821092 RepID=UPI001ADBC216|nr:hypothetical protein [Endozoicomonas sp. G2_2]MBO9471103.1 hypothetical protein [Endozoicomonas sp. G2_2]